MANVKQNKEKRIQFLLRFDLDEYEEFIRKFENSNYSNKSLFIREMIKNGKVKQVNSDVEREKIYQIKKFGNNLNQIANRLNIDHKKGIVSDQTYLSMIEEIQEINILKKLLS